MSGVFRRLKDGLYPPSIWLCTQGWYVPVIAFVLLLKVKPIVWVALMRLFGALGGGRS